MRIMALLTIGLAFSVTGCQHTSITGSESMHERTIHGDVGVAGDDITLTLLSGSDVPKLSIIGEDNRIVVADGARVRKVEIVGEGNTVSVPDDLDVQYSEIGEDNRLENRY